MGKCKDTCTAPSSKKSPSRTSRSPRISRTSLGFQPSLGSLVPDAMSLGVTPSPRRRRSPSPRRRRSPSPSPKPRRRTKKY